MTKKICPNCNGNGFTRHTWEATDVIIQCKSKTNRKSRCQGELDADRHYPQSWDDTDHQGNTYRTIYYGPLLDPESFPGYKIDQD